MVQKRRNLILIFNTIKASPVAMNLLNMMIIRNEMIFLLGSIFLKISLLQLSRMTAFTQNIDIYTTTLHVHCPTILQLHGTEES